MPTSGSTGRPKGVRISQRNLAFYLPALARRLGLQRTDRCLHTAAFTFSSSVRQWLLPLIAGATVILADEKTRKDPAKLAATVSREKVSVLDLVPTHWRTLLGFSWPNRLRLALSASEPLSSEIARGIRKICPDAILISMYGQTETSGITATLTLEEAHLQETFVPLGFPLPGLNFEVSDRDELIVSGPTVGIGYVGSSPFEGRFHTGDQVSRDAEGLYRIHGRLDRQIKVRGHRVDPAEVEHALMGHPQIQGAAVYLRKGRLHGALEVEGALDESSLRESLAQRLPPYMVPSTFSVVAQLPRTDSGKLARNTLEATDSEKLLCQVWSEVLKLPRVEPDDNYFYLGGDSLLSLEIVSRATELGMELSLDQLFQYQTVKKICAAQKGSIEAVRSPTGRLDRNRLHQFCVAALRRAGLDLEVCEALSEVQIESSMRGQPTHNVSDIPRYVERVKKKILNPHPRLRTVRESSITAVLSGDNGPGQWVATQAIDRAVSKARHHGLGLVLVRESNHFGAAGHFAELAAGQGFIGFVTTNGPNILAPTGGVTPLFGNNPIAVAIPRPEEPSLVLDIALSVAPRGKIGLSVQEGKPLQPGWILNALGQPSRALEDLAAGLGVPIGGHKGYGLAFMMEVLAGVLSGSEFGLGHSRSRLKQADERADIGHLFLVVDPEHFATQAEFQNRLKRLTEDVTHSQKADGVEKIYLPGEKEWLKRAESLKFGVPMRLSNYKLLKEFATREGLLKELPEYRGERELTSS